MNIEGAVATIILLGAVGAIAVLVVVGWGIYRLLT